MLLGCVTLASLAAIAPSLVPGSRGVSPKTIPLPPVRARARAREDIVDLARTAAADTSGDGLTPSDGALAVDGRDDTAWTGGSGAMPWTWTLHFSRPRHLGLLRASFGWSTTSGVPTEFHWEMQGPDPQGVCPRPTTRLDDRFSRRLDARGEPVDGPFRDSSGEALESIEGDDPQLDASFLEGMSPPPIVVLSGSNDWDYANETRPDPKQPRRWYWDPLRDARSGGMGQLALAVRSRVAPFLGFCGGAQLLGLLEAAADPAAPSEHQRIIDAILYRNTGQPIRGFAVAPNIERAWPSDAGPARVKIDFPPDDPLFADLAGPWRRSSTFALPEQHADALRRDAFLEGGPLQRFALVAESAFCSPDVIPRRVAPDDVVRNRGGAGWCRKVTQAFRSRDLAWPVIGAQFHPEQRDFGSPAPDDPPESVADPRLFMARAYEQLVDAYLRFAP